MAEALEVAGLRPMEEYIWIREDTIAEYITNRPIYEPCMGAERIPGLSRL